MRLLPLLLCAAILEAAGAQNTTTAAAAGSTTRFNTAVGAIGVSSTPMTTSSVSSLSSSTVNITTSPVTRSTTRVTTARATPTARPAVTRPRTPDPATKVIRRLQVIDLDLLLSNKRILTCYVRCFVGKGPCTPEARDFKKLLPRILSTGCGYCTPAERKVIKKVFLHMYKERYSDWKLIQLKFDPKCKFESKVLGFMGVQKGKKPTGPYKPAIT